MYPGMPAAADLERDAGFEDRLQLPTRSASGQSRLQLSLMLPDSGGGFRSQFAAAARAVCRPSRHKTTSSCSFLHLIESPHWLLAKQSPAGIFDSSQMHQ